MPDAAAAGGDGARRRLLAYAFDYELIEPVILAGGGIIASVAVDSIYGDEHFDVRRRGASMSESIAEMVLPGTYIEVRAEGLISVGAIATGNIGVVGTAARGPTKTVRAIGSYAEALDLFGATDAFTPARGRPADPDAGARAGVRRAGRATCSRSGSRTATPAAAAATLRDPGDAEAFTLTAADAGSYGNEIKFTVVDEGTQAAPLWRLTLTHGRIKESSPAPTSARSAPPRPRRSSSRSARRPTRAAASRRWRSRRR